MFQVFICLSIASAFSFVLSGLVVVSVVLLDVVPLVLVVLVVPFVVVVQFHSHAHLGLVGSKKPFNEASFIFTILVLIFSSPLKLLSITHRFPFLSG
jgi:hypothetical protein